MRVNCSLSLRMTTSVPRMCPQHASDFDDIRLSQTRTGCNMGTQHVPVKELAALKMP